MSHILNVESISSTAYGGIDTDWLEDDNFHFFKFNIPGLKTEDVVVQIVGRDILQVTGRLKGGNEARAGKWHIKERPSGSFFRKFQLPSNVKVNEITAFDEQDGVLVISIPKRKSFIRDVPIAKL